MLRSWLQLFHALRAVEFVWRTWARELGIDGEELLVLVSLWLEPVSCADLAASTGRRRQQVQRTLTDLEHAGLAQPDQTREGRVTRWTLTSRGELILKRLSLRITTWERLVSTDLVDQLGSNATDLVRALVNRLRENGWQRGLQTPVLRPDDLIADDRLVEAATLLGEAPTSTDRAATRDEQSRLRRERDEAEADLAFARLFQ